MADDDKKNGGGGGILAFLVGAGVGAFAMRAASKEVERRAELFDATRRGRRIDDDGADDELEGF